MIGKLCKYMFGVIRVLMKCTTTFCILLSPIILFVAVEKTYTTGNIMLFPNSILAFIFVASLLLYSDRGRPQVLAEVGGHDLFTSLAQLEILWQNDIKVVGVMERLIKRMDRASNALKMYVFYNCCVTRNVKRCSSFAETSM